MIKILSQLNLTQKLLSLLMLTSILPMLLIGLISYRMAQVILRQATSGYMKAMVSDQEQYLESQLNQVESLMTDIASEGIILDALADQEAASSPAIRARIDEMFDRYSVLGGLVSIDIYTQAGGHYYAGDAPVVWPIRTEELERITTQVLESGQPIAWTGIEDNTNIQSKYRKVITAASILTKTDPRTLQPAPVGLCLVSYNPDALYDHFVQMNLGKGAYLMVVDTQNRIIFHPVKSLFGEPISADFARQLVGSNGSFTDQREGTAMMVTFQRSELSRWYVLSLVPAQTLVEDTVAIRTTIILMLAGAFLMVAFSSGLISRSVVQPLREITRRFRMFQEGALDWKARLPLRWQQDEISDLIQWFNIFLDSLEAKEKTETALRESEERYSLASRGANDGIWDWDLRTDKIHYSTRWKAMLGCTDDDIGNSPQDWFKRVHPDDIERLKSEIAAHLDGITPHFENEHRLSMKDQVTYRWFLARGLAVRDAGRKAHRMAGSLTDITGRKTIEERLRYDSLHDPLTNLANRAYFITQIKRAIEHAKRRRECQAAVLFMDLDRFKIVNDSLGHVSGDQLLVAIAQRLSSCLRSEDTLARFGGDEFAILIETINGIGGAIQVANRIQERLSLPFKLKGHDVFMTASIGIALVTGNYNQPEELMRDADTAMYRAKGGGRARYEIFDYEMHANNLALLQLEADLRQAIERQELQLYYQPIVSLLNGEITNVEALIRWQHPDRGLVSPGEFIWLAEETGLILPIGEWILKTACDQLVILHHAGFPHLTVNVNITARQIQDRKFPDMIRRVLRESGLDGRALELEIPESTAMADLAQTAQALREIKGMGVGISIDDFGTGYSSLGYLKRFPINTIKIDRSFVQDSVIDADDAAITTAIIAMGHILGMSVVAEGVETQDQLDLLHGQHCDAIQGFLFIRPVPIAILMNILKNGIPALVNRQPEAASLPSRFGFHS
jgi:diguanylate cyclase (GGDEF)-like protein/PAS domain S-box-containing protein